MRCFWLIALRIACWGKKVEMGGGNKMRCWREWEVEMGGGKQKDEMFWQITVRIAYWGKEVEMGGGGGGGGDNKMGCWGGGLPA